MVEKDKVGGTCLHRGCIPAKELLETAATLPPRRRTPRSSASTPASPTVDFAVTRPASRRSSTSSSRACRAAEEPQGHDLRRHRHARRRPHGHGHGRRRRATSSCTGDARHPRVRLGAPHHPRLRGRRHASSSPPTRCSSLDQLPELGGRHRRRRHRLRVRLDDGRPRHQGHRSSRRCPRSSRAATRRRQRRRARRSRSGASTIRTGVPVDRPQPQRDGGTTCASARARRSSVDAGRSCRSAAARTPTCSGSTAPRSKVDERGFVEVDECCRTGEPGVYAVGDVIATPAARPRRLRRGDHGRSRTSSARSPVPVDYGKVPWASTATPRSPSPATPRRRPRRPASTSSRRSTASRQRPGPDRRRARGHGEGHRREATPTAAPAGSSASTWSARGSPSSSARATWPSTGRPPSTRSPQFIQPHPTLTELFGEARASAPAPGRSLHG